MATDYIMKILGLDICADTVVGNDMLRGISGGQRKRVTTGKNTCPNPVHQEFGKRLPSIGLCKHNNDHCLSNSAGEVISYIK